MLWIQGNLEFRGSGMSELNDIDIEMLINRFEAGDRSPKLLIQLNQAAFECFHAPWETLPSPEQIEIPVNIRLTQGRLPTEAKGDEGYEGDLEHEERNEYSEPCPLPRHPKPRGPRSSSASALPTDPLISLHMALNTMGFRVHLDPGHSLILDLPFDPDADNQSWMAFQANRDSQGFQVFSYGDLALWGLKALEVERLCRIYNRRNSGMVASATRPHEGARIRLRLVTSIPFNLTHSLPALTDHLRQLLHTDRHFWRFVRRNLPI